MTEETIPGAGAAASASASEAESGEESAYAGGPVAVDLQYAVPGRAGIPAAEDFAAFAAAAVAPFRAEAEITVRVVGPEESRALNRTYRGIDRPTNVLSFPAGADEDIIFGGGDGPDGENPFAGPYIGDLVICRDVVEREAAEQGKPPRAHWAHMVVHGCLHLLGFDHLSDAEAEEMESRETAVMRALGFADPYAGDGR